MSRMSFWIPGSLSSPYIFSAICLSLALLAEFVESLECAVGVGRLELPGYPGAYRLFVAESLHDLGRRPSGLGVPEPLRDVVGARVPRPRDPHLHPFLLGFSRHAPLYSALRRITTNMRKKYGFRR